MSVVQIIANSLYGAAVYTLCAVGFALVYRTARFFNFAHGFFIISGPYAAYALRAWTGLALPLACFGGVIIAGGIGCLLELGLFRPMRNRNATPLTLLLASLGAYVVLQNLVSLLFGDHTRVLRDVVQPMVWPLCGARITGMQIVTVAAAVICTVGLILFLQRTFLGRAMRAVSDDAELADICGINSRQVTLLALGVGAALAGFAGILISLDIDLTPSMGLPYLMMTVVVVIIGGRASIAGIVFAACLLSLTQNFGVWFVGAQWRDAIAFALLLMFLVGRTELMTYSGHRWRRSNR